MSAAIEIQRDDIDAVLLRVERGQSSVEDANLLRAYIQRFEALYRLYVLELDDDELVENVCVQT